MKRVVALLCGRRTSSSFGDFLSHNGTVSRTSASHFRGESNTVVLRSSSSSIFENLTAEEALLRGLYLKQDSDFLLMQYVNKPCVVVGRNQNIFQEVSLRQAALDGVRVARRSSGGGAVYHDEENLCLSFFTHRSNYAPEKTIEVLRAALCQLYGLDSGRLTTTSRNDLFLDGLKITGSAMRIQRDIALHHCTLLVGSCRAALGRYLGAEGQYVSFRTSSVGSVRSPVTTLRQHILEKRQGSNQPITAAFQEGFTVPFVADYIASFFHQNASTMLPSVAQDAANVGHREVDMTSSAGAPSVLELMPFDDAYMFQYAEGRHRQGDECATFGEEIQRLSSTAFLFSMPAFTTTVAVPLDRIAADLANENASLSFTSVRACLASLLSGAVDRDGVTAEASSLTILGQDLDVSRVQLHITTVVEKRAVVSVPSVCLCYSDTSGAEEGLNVTWLSNFLSAIFFQQPCDVSPQELRAEIRQCLTGLRLETAALLEEHCAPLFADGDDPDALLDDFLENLALAIVRCWRELNVFDVDFPSLLQSHK